MFNLVVSRFATTIWPLRRFRRGLTPSSRGSPNARRGMSALLTVMVMLSCFVMFTAAVATMAIQRIRGTNTAILQQRANYGCQAGFVWACEWLESQMTY